MPHMHHVNISVVAYGTSALDDVDCDEAEPCVARRFVRWEDVV